MIDESKSNEEYYNNSKNISYSKEVQLILNQLKTCEREGLTGLYSSNIEPRNNNKSNIFSNKKDSDKKNNDNCCIILRKDIRKNNSLPDILFDVHKNNNKSIKDYNSISFYSKKNKKAKKKYNNNDTNNSKFILLQKNTRKNLTDIKLINKKNEKEDITVSNDNNNSNNNNDFIEGKHNIPFQLSYKEKENSSKFKKIKFNNFVHKSSKSYFFLYRQPSGMIKKCFICGNFEKNLFHAEKCMHLFCSICGKTYFEKRINNCIFSLKCPKYLCFKNLNINILKQILSKYIFEKMIENMDMTKTCNNINIKNLLNNNQNNNSSRERIIKKNSLLTYNDNINKLIKENKTFLHNLPSNNTFEKEFAFNSNKNLSKKSKNNLLLKRITNMFPRESDKDLANEHIIKIGGTSKFNKSVKKVNELKNIYCSYCNKPALFMVKNKPFIKCLNCGFSICKFCYKKYDCFHLIRNNKNFCRVYFRSHFSRKNTNYIYISQLFYFLGGLIVMYIGFTKFEAKYLSNYRQNKKFWIYILLVLILIIINFFILIIILPYYPLILLIVEV